MQPSGADLHLAVADWDGAHAIFSKIRRAHPRSIPEHIGRAQQAENRRAVADIDHPFVIDQPDAVNFQIVCQVGKIIVRQTYNWILQKLLHRHLVLPIQRAVRTDVRIPGVGAEHVEL